MAQRGGTVTDASCLTRTPVFGVARPRDEAGVRSALAYAEEHDLVVSVGGTQHALGGQASYPGGLVVDMRGLDAVSVDEAGRTATVQAGATWHQVLEAVHPVGLSVATMPSVDVLSVGGTVSVNAHGMDFRAGSLSSTIRSLRVMLADGAVHRVGPDQQPELFEAVVGGYGLFGVVLDVDWSWSRARCTGCAAGSSSTATSRRSSPRRWGVTTRWADLHAPVHVAGQPAAGGDRLHLRADRHRRAGPAAEGAGVGPDEPARP
ncbi:FAD-dependent oxidoreductase [Ornithinimicrobium sp. LYQ103]|uniref:FAD-binding oxidoreductase n=1 Tax=Ornithinimicrobium sp. LYQ103 TaxID=3378796 RepID=UPI0038551CA2